VIKIATTINDIAKAANVAPSTVSRVIANSTLISEATKTKVLKIMKEMNYHPNMIARSLVRRSTRIVGTLIPETSEKAFQLPFFSEILRGITSKANLSGYKILLSDAGNQKEEVNAISELINSQIVEGLILMSSRLNDKAIDELLSMNFPFVMVGRPESSQADALNWVDNDNCEAGYKMTKYFIEKGHRDIAFIGISPEYMVTLDRLEGYKRALSDFGLPYNENLIVNSQFMEGNGYNMMKLLTGRKEPFTGVVASDDFQAFAAINFLNERGINVPDDIAVAGFNNVPQSEYYVPSLTSIEVHAYNLGEKAFDILFNHLKNKKLESTSQFVKTDLVKRKSC
jgi:DNA-binding LacI/PurR family transcriptional regulator